jgi:hypothetical protein
VNDELMFVQFPHPGSEHEPRGPVMDWNRGDHKRKFLKASGDYVVGDVVDSGPITFWGEWEPQSRVVETYPKTGLSMPRRLQEPYWRAPAGSGPWQNTDPLVFGDRFLYSNCRQPTNGKLRALAPGSLILFGSNLGGEFVLDTVFVVGSRTQEFTAGTSESLDCDGWVREVVFERLRESACAPPDETGRRPSTCTPAGPLRLYESVTYDERPGGPFSFVPCRPFETGGGFSRPDIHLQRGLIEPNLRMGAKATQTSAGELASIWKLVVDQVADAGLALGVRMDVPPNVAGPAS